MNITGSGNSLHRQRGCWQNTYNFGIKHCNAISLHYPWSNGWEFVYSRFHYSQSYELFRKHTSIKKVTVLPGLRWDHQYIVNILHISPALTSLPLSLPILEWLAFRQHCTAVSPKLTQESKLADNSDICASRVSTINWCTINELKVLLYKWKYTALRYLESFLKMAASCSTYRWPSWHVSPWRQRRQ